MTVNYSTKIATKYGINAALVAAYLCNKLKNSHNFEHGYHWARCSRKTLTAIYPFLGEKAVANALNKLIKHGVLIKREYNSSRFDRTLSFAFTAYGYEMVEECND